MLELRPTCENCNKKLPPNSIEAMICSFECTFCKSCVQNVLKNVCPNCGGGFHQRPIRPANKLIGSPAGTKVIFKPVDKEIHKKYAASIRISKLIPQPKLIKAVGFPVKEIQEFIGRVNTQTEEVSIARMVSPQGWSEPGQTPEFNEYTVVLKGALHLKLKDQELVVKAGQAVIVSSGEWVQYSTPDASGAEYIAVCLPAFSPQTVHRE